MAKGSIYDDPAVAGEVSKLLRFDGLAAAGRITGKDYKNDDPTGFLGLVLAIESGATKEAILLAADDTQLTNDVGRYVRILQEEGFVLCLAVPFQGHETLESLQVWWHRGDGLLLRFDTFGGDHVNAAEVYYNWQPASGQGDGFASSGHWRRDGDAKTNVGSRDAREGLRLALHNLRAHGTLLAKWVESPFLWLLHYMDTKAPGFDDKAITRERIRMLPAEVRLAIGERP